MLSGKKGKLTMTTTTKNSIKLEIKENLYLIIGLIVAIVLPVLLYGCQSKVQSISSPEKQVTRSELIAEINHFLASAEIRQQQLDRQDKLRKQLFETGFRIAETGTLNPIALLTTLGSIIGAGAIGDNIRKRKTIHSNLVDYVNQTKYNGPDNTP